SETRQLGQNLGQKLAPNAVVCFFGDLGAGKTTFIQGLVAGVTGCAPEDVCSPTFVYLNIYEGAKTVYHFDLYRLKDPEEFVKMGFDEYFQAGGICCLEWSERIADLIPPDAIQVRINHVSEQKREICLKAPNL
ncbi:MAG: tRNA (adenosine(37)-N6)-threonylcarbamoyltransferase complex ATPase subunit type 1 TsaE, partial [Parachlamydia sp.]|nr:tRNA (adenosine(37)-N6)-threonylcarbamoyltransferase complex ATPase subunit type 1 TsaE [Parachlamydia sp.]